MKNLLSFLNLRKCICVCLHKTSILLGSQQNTFKQADGQLASQHLLILRTDYKLSKYVHVFWIGFGKQNQMVEWWSEMKRSEKNVLPISLNP